METKSQECSTDERKDNCFLHIKTSITPAVSPASTTSTITSTTKSSSTSSSSSSSSSYSFSSSSSSTSSSLDNLMSLLSSSSSPSSMDIVMPPNPGSEFYEYSKSTEENYCSPDSPFVGKYSQVRSRLDYSYHMHYSVERQEMHDKLIDQFLTTIVHDGERVCECPLEPWLVFTAGCMGAGKGHTMHWLFEHDLFPLDAFVKVDPDSLRVLLPETQEYIRQNPRNAGFLTQKEVGYISEVLTMDALNLGKNVLIDGSLRNADWYKQYIATLRSQFPNLKIGIIFVTASEETILSRARRRAETTGRLVPEEVIHETLQQLPDSLSQLSPLVDSVTAFENEQKPRMLFLSSFGEDVVPPHSDKLKDGLWHEIFANQWLMTCPTTPKP